MLTFWIAPALVLLATLVLLWPLRRALERRALVDRPNDRSSHACPIPRGAGIVVVPAVALGWWAIAGFASPIGPVLLIGLGLAAIGWLDDLRNLPVWPRLAAQVIAVAACIGQLPQEAHVFQGVLALPMDRLLAGCLWLWFVNLYNFMDGIDGLAGATAAIIGAAAAGLLLAAGAGPAVAAQAAVLAGAALGFLAWNWPPARIFLGDVGSVGLGFLIGWLLLGMAAAGFWASALLLPLYHLADASLTLLLRLGRGENIWRPSRAHFYQRAAVALGSHRAALLRIAALQLGLAGLALFAALRPQQALPAVLVGGLSVAALLCYFARIGRKAGNAHG